MPASKYFMAGEGSNEGLLPNTAGAELYLSVLLTPGAQCYKKVKNTTVCLRPGTAGFGMLYKEQEPRMGFAREAEGRL